LICGYFAKSPPRCNRGSERPSQHLRPFLASISMLVHPSVAK
jgi:hypothetical protein